MNKECLANINIHKLFQLDLSHKAYPEAEQNYIFLSAPTAAPGITDPTTPVNPPTTTAPTSMHHHRKRSVTTFDSLGGMSAGLFKLGMSAGQAMASTGFAARTALVGMTQTNQPILKPHSETATTSSEKDSIPDPEDPILQQLYGKSHTNGKDGKGPNPNICKRYNDRLSPLAMLTILSIAVLLTTVACSGCFHLSKGTKYNPKYLDDLYVRRQE